MATDEQIHDLMLDALRIAYIRLRGGSRPAGDRAMSSSVSEKIKFMSVHMNQLDYEHKMQVCLAVVRLAGFEALGEYNCGSFVNMSEWTPEQVDGLYKIVQFSMK